MKLILHAVTVMVLAVLAAPLAIEAQQPAKVPRIGFLRAGPPPPDFVEGFREGLREFGYVEGQNIIIEYRFTDGSTSQLGNLVTELLQRKVDVVVASGSAAALAAKNLTQTVPIVLAGVNDPVDSRLVNSLSRPGGNITGMSLMSVDLVAKRVELLKELSLDSPASPSWEIQPIHRTRPRSERLRPARGLSQFNWKSSARVVRTTSKPQRCVSWTGRSTRRRFIGTRLTVSDGGR